ncbi:extracellular solute-binding protein [Peribacillus cavernae]|uniref:Extracellular solute-binding protein n=1 Tax=Peribacillus cavernae TaxID=1674310 RepID=A0A433HNV7_9BACI|nr:extracellular solute-binding protein [Peribacillus cavernae]MDQ0217562.1 arabinogalactan oligomer/maltooligosaccharide transport system substrate-binding protein [Peribacillus cavernae]RUQ30004.1 extracellular solute-binding protein [Peribacillus cavernae]
MKKSFYVLQLLVLMTGVLIGCNNEREAKTENAPISKKTIENKTEEPKPEKLVVWEDVDNQNALIPAIESFEKEYGIKVEWKEMHMAEKIRRQLRIDGPSGNAPDVVTLPNDQIGQAVTEGLIQEINVENNVLNMYIDPSIHAEKYDGKLFGLPKAIETPVFVYNKKLMPKAPRKMDEVYAQAREYRKSDKYGFIALWDHLYFAQGVLGGFGGYLFKDNGKAFDRNDIGLNNKGTIQGARYIQKWYKEGLFPHEIIGANGKTGMDQLFSEGKAVSVMTDSSALKELKKTGIDIGVSAMPKLPNGEHMKPFLAVKGWHVTAFTKSPDWSTILVQYLANEENAKIRFEKTQQIPAVKSLLQDPILTKDEAAKAVAVQSRYAVPLPTIPEKKAVWKPADFALHNIATGKAEPEAALDVAVKEITGKLD